MERIEEYTQLKAALEKELFATKNQLTNLSVLRLLVFALTGVLVYATFNQVITPIIMGLIGIISFTRLLFRYLKVSEKKKILLAKIELNRIEIKAQQKDVSSLDSGKKFINSNHAFSHDIDLFGEGSFYQYINRTSTKEGAQRLATSLTENTIDFIKKKQDAIAELATMMTWRQHFSAIASLVKVDVPTKTIVDFIRNYEPVFSKRAKQLPVLFTVLSVVIITAVSFQWIAINWLLLWFFVGMGITGSFLKRTQDLYTKAGKAKGIFKQYHQLLQQIENEDFSSEWLLEQQKAIQSEKEKASTIFMKFSKRLDAFDQRNNLFIAFLGNAFLLWDLQCAARVEFWIEDYQHTVEKWFEVIEFFDAQNSLGNFCYNHPSYVMTDIKEEGPIIQSEALGHPLLHPDKRVNNDFRIDKRQFYVVTGANMAGKSTFLRTVSLSIVMANIGLPVCAKRFEYVPIRLITSMRTSDSLADDESYFYSELKRLKFIVDEIDLKDYFIILDEILKGTNSKDKAIGSKKFVEKLVASQSTGIIATHDVSLCELEKELPQIQNYYFDAQIVENELYFDYTFQKGVCQNMNASFLLNKMKII